MPPLALRRCSICRRWGAAYRVKDPAPGRRMLSKARWQQRQK
jgi:hypothetical protein